MEINKIGVFDKMLGMIPQFEVELDSSIQSSGFGYKRFFGDRYDLSIPDDVTPFYVLSFDLTIDQYSNEPPSCYKGDKKTKAIKTEIDISNIDLQESYGGDYYDLTDEQANALRNEIHEKIILI